MTEDEQTAELADALEALEARYADIPPELASELRGLKQKCLNIAAYKQAGDAQRVIGLTHISIRQHQDDTDSRVAGVQEDMAGLHEEQDTTAAHLAAAASGLERLATRVRRCEQEIVEIRAQLAARRTGKQKTAGARAG